jgi:hypothetical protein
MDPIVIIDFIGLATPVIPAAPPKKDEVAITLKPNQIRTKTHQAGGKAPVWNEKFPLTSQPSKA